MSIVDSHLHLWDRLQFTYPWQEGEWAQSFLVDDIDCQDLDISSAVFVQADCLPKQAMDEARWAAHANPLIGRVVAFAPLEDGKAIESSLDELSTISKVTGVRRMLRQVSDDFFADTSVREGLREVARRGYTFDVCVNWSQLEFVDALLESAPNILAIVDHLGNPPLSAGLYSPEGAAWRLAMSTLARHNTRVKISGWQTPGAPARADRELALPFVEATLDIFGATRCMLGSDWPISAPSKSGKTYAGAFFPLPRLSQAELDAVQSGVARDTYFGVKRTVPAPSLNDRNNP